MKLENAYAIIVGVGGEDFEITIEDANAIHAILIDKDKAAYNENNVTLLTDVNATKENFLNALENVILKTDQIEDSTVLIYFSGHGVEYREEESNEYYLMTHGGDMNNKENTMFNGKLLSEKLSKIKSNKLLVMLDCCYAAAIKDDSKSLKLKGLGNVVLKGSSKKLLESLEKGEGRVFISSCDDDELSAILPNSKNSLFTEVIIEALNGEASGKSEFVHVIDIMAHVIKEVPFRISQYNHLQRPIINEVLDLSPEYFICLNSSYQEQELVTKNLFDEYENEIKARKLKDIKDYVKNYNFQQVDLVSENSQIITNKGNIKQQLIIKKNIGDMTFN